MDYLNTTMENMGPYMTSFFQLFIICVESFFVNVYVAGKCVYLYMNIFHYKLEDFSVANYNEIINVEIKEQKNPLLSKIGVWVGMIFCFSVLWTVIENLAFPIVKVTLWWLLVWSVCFSLKEKVGVLFFGKQKTE